MPRGFELANDGVHASRACDVGAYLHLAIVTPSGSLDTTQIDTVVRIRRSISMVNRLARTDFDPCKS